MRRFLLVICPFLFTFFLNFCVFDLEVNALTIKQNDELVVRIAKDFSKKFCNGVGFGLSKESAVNFAMKENISSFKNKKGIESINTEAIVEKASNLVVDKCGYSLTLSEDEWGQSFKNVKQKWYDKIMFWLCNIILLFFTDLLCIWKGIQIKFILDS